MDAAVDVDAGSPRGFGKMLEIHMAREVRFAGVGKRRVVFMHAHGLQRIAEASRHVAVVDDQRRAAMVAQPLADALSSRPGGQARTRRSCRAAASAYRPAEVPGRGSATPAAKPSSSSASRPTTRSRKPVGVVNELADRDGVEKFVGGNQGEAGGYRRRNRSCQESLSPWPASVSLLDVAQALAGFDQVDGQVS